MNKLISFLPIVLSLLLVHSCTSLKHVSYERLQAADVSYPEQVRRVGVVNFMPVVDTLSQPEYRLPYVSEGDGRVAIDQLAQEIAATNYFDEVVICDSSFRQDPSWTDGEIPEGLVERLGAELGVDVLFALERVQIELKEGHLYVPEFMATLPALDAVVTPLLSVYVPGRKAPLYTVSKADSIAWEVTSTLSFEQAIREASQFAATIPVTYLLPHWKTMERYYFDGGDTDMRDAGVYVREENWTEAFPLWQKVYDRKKGKAKLRAAFNLAVYHEMQEDFEQAQRYLQEALSLASEDSWERTLVLYYQAQLQEQEQKNKMLKIQMRRFE